MIHRWFIDNNHESYPSETVNKPPIHWPNYWPLFTGNDPWIPAQFPTISRQFTNTQSQQFGLFWYWTPGWHCWSNWPMQSRPASWPHNNEDKWDVCVVIPPPGASQELPCRLHRHLPSYPVNAIPGASLLIWRVESAPGTLSSAADVPDECSPGHILPQPHIPGFPPSAEDCSNLPSPQPHEDAPRKWAPLWLPAPQKLPGHDTIPWGNSSWTLWPASSSSVQEPVRYSA